MELICAGYPKTGSKSCSEALRILGFTVADYVETAEFLSYVWRDFIEGKVTIDAVIAEYKRNGFDTNQDFPGNFMWKDLYNASPNAKVILTVRESTEKWQKSLANYFIQENSRPGNPGSYIGDVMMQNGWMGPKMDNMLVNVFYIMERYLFPGVRAEKRFFSWQGKIQYLSQFYNTAAEGYEKHNALVKSIVPSENLLIWDVKDGWEPLCKFLNKDVPDIPIPHENKTGEKKWLEKYFFESNFGKEMFEHLKWNAAICTVKIVSIGGLILYMRKRPAILASGISLLSKMLPEKVGVLLGGTR